MGLTHCFLLVSFPLLFSFGCQAAIKFPELLVTQEGQTITTQAEWERHRSQLTDLLQSHIYGYAPGDITPRIEVGANQLIEDGIYREVKLHIPTTEAGEHSVTLALFLPPTPGPHPVILLLNKCGNQTVYQSSLVSPSGTRWVHESHCYDRRGRRLGIGSQQAAYGITQTLRAGYAVATIAESDLAADSPRQGHIGLKEKFTPHTQISKRWGNLRVWAWGLSRAVDYLVQAPDIDPTKIVTTGHSRRGKAALIAAAFDKRIAATLPHMSGLGGTAPFRRTSFRETAAMVAFGWFGYFWMGERNGLTHFFAQSLRDHAHQVNDLPVDTNALVALVAPRLLLDVQGKKDFWAGPKDALANLDNATQVWDLLGASENRPVQRVLNKAHHMGAEDWEVMLEFLKERGF